MRTMPSGWDAIAKRCSLVFFPVAGGGPGLPLTTTDPHEVEESSAPRSAPWKALGSSGRGDHASNSWCMQCSRPAWQRLGSWGGDSQPVPQGHPMPPMCISYM